MNTASPTPSYLGWYDDDSKKTPLAKIDEARERYAQRYGYWPNICLISSREPVEHPSIRTRPDPLLRLNNYYLGFDATIGPQLAFVPNQIGAVAAPPPPPRKRR